MNTEISTKQQLQDVDTSVGRVIAHIDLDCFYVGVERYVNPSLRGKPCAVVQYNPFGDLKTYGPYDNRQFDSNGSIIAVSYEARACGVKRNMRGNEAKSLCKDIILVQVPTAHGKADLTIYRKLSNDIVNIIMDINLPLYREIAIEKASIDEVYLDISKGSIELYNLISSFSIESESSSTSISISTSVSSELSAISLVEEAGSGKYSFKDYVQYFLIQQKQCEEENQYQQTNQPQNQHPTTLIEDCLIENSDLCSSQENSRIDSIPIGRCWFKLAGDDMSELSMSRYDLSKGYDNTSTSTSSIFSITWLQRSLRLWSYNDKLLIYGSILIQYIRQQIYDKLHLTCSSGISFNKMLAKIASVMHKPNKLTVFPSSMIDTIFAKLPITRVPGYNGKLGQEIQDKIPSVQYMGEFQSMSKDSLLSSLGGSQLSKSSHEYSVLEATVNRLLMVSKGQDNEPVVARSIPKSIGCGKTFRHQNSLFLKDIYSLPSTISLASQPSNNINSSNSDIYPSPTKFSTTATNVVNHHHKNQTNKLFYWLRELASELFDRCQDDATSNSRSAKQLSIGFSILLPVPKNYNSSNSNQITTPSKDSSLSYTKNAILPKTIDLIALKSYELIKTTIHSSVSFAMKTKGYDIKTSSDAHISYLSLSASDFVSIASEKNSIKSYFTKNILSTTNSYESLPIVSKYMDNVNTFCENIEDLNEERNEEMYENLDFLEQDDWSKEKGDSIIEQNETSEVTRDEISSSLMTDCVDKITNATRILSKDATSINNISPIDTSYYPTKLEEIDNETLSALPLDIRNEILQALKSSQHPTKTMKVKGGNFFDRNGNNNDNNNNDNNHNYSSKKKRKVSYVSDHRNKKTSGIDIRSMFQTTLKE